MDAEAQTQNAEQTVTKVLGLVAALEAGSISREGFADAFAAVTYAGKVRAARIAEVALWRWSLRFWPAPITPLGILPSPDALPALHSAALTISEPESGPEDQHEDVEASETPVLFRTSERAERVARSAPLEAGREALVIRMHREGISRWRWVAQPDSCDECRARHGTTYPIDTPFRDHPRCTCTLEPTTEEMKDDDRAAA